MMKDLCVMCGNVVPEGRQVCPICEADPSIRFINTDDKVQVHLMICTTLNSVYEMKNHDYGDSFAKLRNELPGAILVRIYDKYSRLKTLMQGAEQKVKDESIEGTLMDLKRKGHCIDHKVKNNASNP